MPGIARVTVCCFLILQIGTLPGSAVNLHLPAKPEGYFTDEAGIIDATEGQKINERLALFERQTSNQVLVAIYPTLPEGTDVAQFSIDTFNDWKPGQAGKDNGAVLFIYVTPHKIFICTGKGLEKELPDKMCKDIVETIVPAFRNKQFAQGVEEAVDIMIARTTPATGLKENAFKSSDLTKDQWKARLASKYPIFGTNGILFGVKKDEFICLFGVPDKTETIGEDAYWYYNCSDGAIQVVITAQYLRVGIINASQINDY